MIRKREREREREREKIIYKIYILCLNVAFCITNISFEIKNNNNKVKSEYRKKKRTAKITEKRTVLTLCRIYLLTASKPVRIRGNPLCR